MGSNLYRLFGRIGALFKGREFDADLEEELAHHLQALAEENIKSGVAPDEALRQAHISLGGVAQIREIHRDSRGIPWFEQSLRDLRYASRFYRREERRVGKECRSRWSPYH